jgi:SAM-dependent methyltransferase
MPNNIPLPFDALRPFKSKPEEFSPRDTLPWEMLAERFPHYQTEAGFLGLRSLAQVEADVDWLAKHLAPAPGAAILDIGCGPGLYSNRLAAHGYQVTGIDIAQAFLDHAQAEAQAQGVADNCTYRQLSMFDMAYETEFETVLLIQSIASRLDLTELQTLLTKIHAALKPAGHFLAEFQVTSSEFASNEATITESISFLAHSPWSDQFHAWLLRDLIFPDAAERVNHHLLLNADGQLAEYWSRFSLYSIPALTGLWQACGFRVQAVFGQTLGQPHQAADETCFFWVQRFD